METKGKENEMRSTEGGREKKCKSKEARLKEDD